MLRGGIGSIFVIMGLLMVAAVIAFFMAWEVVILPTLPHKKMSYNPPRYGSPN